MQEDRSMPNKDQPPQLRPYIADTIAKLRSHAETSNAQMAKTKHQATQPTTTSRTETDYKVLIHDWYHAMPPAHRQRRYTSDELLKLFAGRYRDRPAVRMIAAALRANGFTSHRDWSNGGCNQRYWLPPKTNE